MIYYEDIASLDNIDFAVELKKLINRNMKGIFFSVYNVFFSCSTHIW